MGEQVNDVSKERSRKVARVRAQAERVPVLSKYFFFISFEYLCFVHIFLFFISFESTSWYREAWVLQLS